MSEQPPEPGDSAAQERILTVVLIGAMAILLGYFGVVGVTDVLRVNDFGVFYQIGNAAAVHDAGLYEIETGRGPFLYPPSGAIFLAPLAWCSYETAGVIFALLKIPCLVLLYFGAVWFCGLPRPATAGFMVLVAITAFVVFRPVNNDVGNGQVNLFVATAAVAGVWLIMGPRRWAWVGPLLLSFAIAFKLTPVLLTAVPLLAGRWRAVAATVVLTVLMVVALPVGWFGTGEFASMSKSYRNVMNQFLTESRDGERQMTINSIIQFTAAGIHADPEAFVVRDYRPYQEVDGELIPARLPEAMSRRTASVIWLAVGLSAGAVFLGYRWWLKRRGFVDWTWDLAMLCVLAMLLPPQVRKAHLVILIVPTAWLAARLLWLMQDPGGLGKRGWLFVLVGLFGLYTAGMMASDDLKIYVSDVFPLPYRACVFLAMLFLLVALMLMPRALGYARVGSPEPTGDSPAPA